MLTWFHNDWGLLFFLTIGGAMGFVLLGIVATGKRADEQSEALEQIVRREP